MARPEVIPARRPGLSRINLPPTVLALILVAPVVAGLAYLAATNPKDAIAAAVFAGILVALFSNLTLGVCLFIALQFALPVFASDSVVKFLGLALVVRWLIEVAYPNPALRLKSFARRYPLMTAFLIASLVYAVVSATWAPNPDEVYSNVGRYALDVVLLATIFSATRNREALRWIAVAITCGAGLTVAILLEVGTSIDASRLSDSGIDPNELAMTLVAAILLGCLLAIQSHSRRARLFFAAVVLLDFYGLLLTNSRGGLLAMTAALFTWVVVGGRWRSRLAFAGLIALVSAVAYIAVVAPEVQRARVEGVLGIGNQPVDRSGAGRTSIWAVGVRAFKAHPLQGSGYGNYRDVSPHYLLVEPGLVESRYILHPLVAHNTYLQSLVEVGVLGSLLFFAPVAGALVAFLLAARRFRRSRLDDLEFFARTGFAAFVGVLVASFFISEGQAKILWIMIGLGFGLHDLYRRQQDIPKYAAP
jgi:O-antigen ligase